MEDPQHISIFSHHFLAISSANRPFIGIMMHLKIDHTEDVEKAKKFKGTLKMKPAEKSSPALISDDIENDSADNSIIVVEPRASDILCGKE